MIDAVAGRRVGGARGEYTGAQQPGERPERQVAEQQAETFLHPVQRVLARPAHQWQILLWTPLVFEAFQRCRGEIQLAENVTQTRRQAFLAFERTAERHHRDIGTQCEGGAHPVQLLKIVPCRPIDRCTGKASARQAEEQAARDIAEHEADVTEDRMVEVDQATPRVRVLCGLELFQDPRMAAHRTLTENNHAAGQDVGALDGDRDRDRLVGTTDQVGRSQADAAAALDVHRVVDAAAVVLGQVILDDRRDHRGLLADIQRTEGQCAGGVHLVGEGGDPRQRLFDALEMPDRPVELLADRRIGTGETAGGLACTDAQRRQRDTATLGQALDQHAPALADVSGAADQLGHRDEHVVALVGTVLERDVQGHMTFADTHARCLAWHQRQGDAQVRCLAQQVIRVIQFERETEQGADRPQGDVSLLPVQAHTQHAFTAPVAMTYHATVRDRAGIAACFRPGQREAGHLLTACQARQVVVLLFAGTVVQQQLSRAQRVGHHHGDRGGDTAAGEFHHHL